MKKSEKTDKICIKKILEYIDDIKDCFDHYSIESYKNLENKRIAQYAITQIITNIYELKKKIGDETLSKLPEFDKIRLAGARNIASHNYDRVNFEIIYDICKMLLNVKIERELKEVAKDGGDSNDE